MLIHRRRAVGAAGLVRCLLGAVVLGAVGLQLLQPTGAAAQTPGDAVLAQAAQEGERLANRRGCMGCHSIDGSRRTGPTWQGLAGSQVRLADGSTVTADDAYLKRAILDPDAQVVEGFPKGVMSSVIPSGSVSEQDADALIAYIKTLGTAKGGARPAPATPAPSPTGQSTPAAATSPPGPPAIYYVGWGLLALGALIALVSIVAYLRFLPDFQRHRRQ